MKIVDRYLRSCHLRLISLSLGAFVAIFLVIDFLEKIGKFSRGGATLTQMGTFFACRLPEVLVQVIPLAVLMGTILSIGALSRQSEITAMRSGGMSLLRIGRPLLMVGAAISIGTFAMEEFLVPPASGKARYLEEVVIGKKNPNTFFRQDNIWYRDRQAILQARLFEPATRSLRGVTLWRLGDDLQPQTRLDADRALFTDRGWEFRKVSERQVAGGTAAAPRHLDTMLVPLSLKMDDLKVVGKHAENMGYFALRRYCAKLEQGGYETTAYRAVLQSKLALPCTSLVMVFLGIPFALKSNRSSGIAVGVGISLGIGFSYYILSAILISFGQAGTLPPLLAAWAANVLCTGAGIWLAMTVER